MLVYTIGIPLSIFAFLLVGALVGTAGPDPNTGLMPGFIAGCAVFGLCMFIQRKANTALENPEPIEVNCSPERAFNAVYECLQATHIGPNYWSIQPLQNSLRIMGTLRFDDLLCAGERLECVSRQLRLTASISTNVAGKTVVKLAYSVDSPRGRWTCDEGIAKTTNWIRRELISV